jgi:hypothetical protein
MDPWTGAVYPPPITVSPSAVPFGYHTPGIHPDVELLMRAQAADAFALAAGPGALAKDGMPAGYDMGHIGALNVALHRATGGELGMSVKDARAMTRRARRK